VIDFWFKDATLGIGDHRVSISRRVMGWGGENGRSRVVMRGGRVRERAYVNYRGWRGQIARLYNSYSRNNIRLNLGRGRGNFILVWMINVEELSFIEDHMTQDDGFAVKSETNVICMLSTI